MCSSNALVKFSMMTHGCRVSTIEKQSQPSLQSTSQVCQVGIVSPCHRKMKYKEQANDPLQQNHQLHRGESIFKSSLNSFLAWVCDPVSNPILSLVFLAHFSDR